jgi:hypothetical protein
VKYGFISSRASRTSLAAGRSAVPSPRRSRRRGRSDDQRHPRGAVLDALVHAAVASPVGASIATSAEAASIDTAASSATTADGAGAGEHDHSPKRIARADANGWPRRWASHVEKRERSRMEGSFASRRAPSRPPC